MIIQGTNKPIIINFSDNAELFKDISVCLVSLNNIAIQKIIKIWDKADLIINGEIVECPQNQMETAKYPTGSVKILVKWLNADGNTEFSEKIDDYIIPWEDKTLLGGEMDD